MRRRARGARLEARWRFPEGTIEWVLVPAERQRMKRPYLVEPALLYDGARR